MLHDPEKEKRKDYTFWRQLNEKPSITPGCPVIKRYQLHGLYLVGMAQAHCHHRWVSNDEERQKAGQEAAPGPAPVHADQICRVRA